ncbi:DUF1847 domain-containing protein [Anaeromusa sp.]|jgi:uncharacterized metal-binding protein|uniref:DUF1847 domain-containing protein n=1 Tax=Anaeromusa sp. TaxID=1872520 RepID=UPI002603FB68|nr:DUF1847 domain-containing protein [Anaeromusa sp.]MDD3158433.1 DUF1847 domain-containing protein [Anaeromusa sp.]
MKCAQCGHKNCYKIGQNCLGWSVEDVKEQYHGRDLEMMQAAACTEGRYYLKLTRLEESVEFAKLLGTKKIGLAFCIGLAEEAKLIEAYFAKFFEVHSVCCKVCAVEKNHLGLEPIKDGAKEVMCNPKVQAAVLNKEKTELNFTVGLCVGHDMLFTSASAAPVSCLVAKDRVMAHNPLGAIYSRYWRRKLGILPEGQV